MPAIYHEGSWLGNATDPEVLVKDTVGWTGKNRAYSQTNNAVIAHIENGITYDVSWTGSATVTLKKNSASDATITSGSTSPLSFTADADYELYFGSSATVTNIMVKDSRITDPTYEPYHDSVEEEIEQVYADNGVLGAKNLLPYPYYQTTRTTNGITFTDNGDGTITANGTATADAIFHCLTHITGTTFYQSLAGKAVILSGCPAGGANNKYYFGIYDTSAHNDVGEGLTYQVPDTTPSSFYIQIVIRSGITVNNLKFYPMIRLASDPDDTYQPYAMTNRELTESVASKALSFTLSTANATLLRNESKIKGDVVSVRVQLQVTSEIASGTELLRTDGTPHVGFGVAVLGNTNTGNMYETFIASSSSNLSFTAKNTIPTGYYALNYTYIQ